MTDNVRPWAMIRKSDNVCVNASYWDGNNETWMPPDDIYMVDLTDIYWYDIPSLYHPEDNTFTPISDEQTEDDA